MYSICGPLPDSDRGRWKTSVRLGEKVVAVGAVLLHETIERRPVHARMPSCVRDVSAGLLDSVLQVCPLEIRENQLTSLVVALVQGVRVG